MRRTTHGRPIALVLSMFLLLFAPATAFAGGDANFLIGLKAVDEDDWTPVDDQGAFGVEVTFGKEAWPVWIAIDYFGSSEVEEDLAIDVGGFTFIEDLTGSTFELDLGARKIWGNHVRKTRPFLGGGVGLIGGEIDADIVSDDDTTLGLWVGGGVFWRLGSRFNIGGSVRYSQGEITLFDSDIQAGGLTYGLLLGWGWPAGS